MSEVEVFSPATDVGAFAEQVLGRPLWDYQLSIARSSARYRVVCAGRQVGKSVTLSAVALFEASTRANILVLIVSAGETAAMRLLEECSSLASGSLALAGSVVDDSKTLLTLSNGSVIRSVPASVKQIRGWPVDVLILDEAGFIGSEIWQAAEPAIIARPGSRVILVSSPWGGVDHFFRQLWQRGMDAPDLDVESWHLPSSASPLVDDRLLEGIRSRNSEEYFRREFLAEWTDDSGSYFKEAEIMGAVADYEMCSPEDLEFWVDGRFAAAAGVDWGLNDANVLTLVSVLEDYGLNRELLGDKLVFFVPWYEARHRWGYTDFIERIVESAKFYHLPVVASEVNGVGQYPTTMLQDRMFESRHYSPVVPVVTDVRRKQSGFGMIKGLLQARRLVLPRDPELLKQLRGLEFEMLPAGGMRISVPERAGHDDIAMSFMQAVSSLRLEGATRQVDNFSAPLLVPADEDIVETSNGLRVPVRARPVSFHRDAFGYPKGSESGEGW